MPVRVKRFLGLSTGLFSAVSLGIAFLGYEGFGSVESAGENFLAALGSGDLFRSACTFDLGPEDP